MKSRVGVKIVRGLELHALAQMERIFERVGGDIPALGETRNHVGGAAIELGEAVIDGTGGRIERGAGRIQSRIETFRRTFRAINKGLGLGCTRGKHRSADQRRYENL